MFTLAVKCVLLKVINQRYYNFGPFMIITLRTDLMNKVGDKMLQSIITLEH